MIAFLDFPAILSPVDPPTLVASIARTGEDRRGQVPIWGLRPRLFASAPPLGWTDAPEAANGMFLVRHASRHVSGGEPASIQPDTEFSRSHSSALGNIGDWILSSQTRDFRVPTPAPWAM